MPNQTPVSGAGQRHRTTIADNTAGFVEDYVERHFNVERPNQRWVADFTYVATSRRFVNVAFVIDVFSRRIGGWRCGFDDVEMATQEWGAWFNQERLLEPLGKVPPAKFVVYRWCTLIPIPLGVMT